MFVFVFIKYRKDKRNNKALTLVVLFYTCWNQTVSTAEWNAAAGPSSAGLSVGTRHDVAVVMVTEKLDWIYER